LLQREFHQLVRERVARGTAVLLSSHVLPEVEQLAGRVGILRRGRLVTTATIAELHQSARQRIRLVVHHDVDTSVFDGLDEIVELDVADRNIHVVVEGSVDRVLKAAAKLQVDRITTEDTDLEDVFLGYYDDEKGA
jgi:ABC-2 type transport system ATP-binding protein